MNRRPPMTEAGVGLAAKQAVCQSGFPRPCRSVPIHGFSKSLAAIAHWHSLASLAAVGCRQQARLLLTRLHVSTFVISRLGEYALEDSMDNTFRFARVRCAVLVRSIELLVRISFLVKWRGACKRIFSRFLMSHNGVTEFATTYDCSYCRGRVYIST